MDNSVILMAAPNGAWKTKSDHPNVPLSIAETVDEAVACHEAGASVLHAHVRDREGKHILDPERYKELVAELKNRAPDLLVQITTEAVGCYEPHEQISCVQSVLPQMASVAMREITADFTELDQAKRFYHWSDEAGVHIQHILYSAEDALHFRRLQREGIIPSTHRCVLFVLGRYSKTKESAPSDLLPFLGEGDVSKLDWFVCAFGAKEHDCIKETIIRGGHARVGFENNLYLPNGEVAESSAELISLVSHGIKATGRVCADAMTARKLLGIVE